MTIAVPNAPIPTAEVPQADSLDKVIETVYAVSQGQLSHQEIARHLGVKDRQGRYYRLAAEILKLVTKTSSKNVAALTPAGSALLTANEEQRKQLLRNQILQAPVFQSIIGMIASSNGQASRQDIEDSLSKLVPLTTEGMINRRLSTILSWLETLDIIEKINHDVRLKSIPTTFNTIEIPDVGIPVLPKPNELKLFEKVNQRKVSASESIKFQVDRAKFDRANNTHERLRSILAEKIRAHNSVPTWNKYIDLAVNMDNQSYLIEVKTSENVRSQVRRGIAQLYEYRYLQALPEAKLVLLLEKPLIGSEKWMLDYIEKDREIFVIWDDRDNQLFATEDGMKTLPFMNP